MEGATVSGAVLPAPIGVDSFWQPRRAAFWVLLFFLANGLYSVIGMGLSGHAVVPQGMWTAVAVWTLYALPFLLLLRMLDLSVQISTVALVLAFAWGGLGAVYLAVPANDAILALAAKLGSPEFRSSWGAAIAGPTTEELLKYVGMVLLVLVARTQFLTPLAIVVTGAMVGLGFQIVEDFVYSINAAAGASDDDQVGPVLSMLVVRGFLCGLWSHAVYTAVASFGLAQFLLRTDLSFAARLGRAVLFFALGWTLHAAWNSPLPRANRSPPSTSFAAPSLRVPPRFTTCSASCCASVGRSGSGAVTGGAVVTAAGVAASRSEQAPRPRPRATSIVIRIVE